MKTGKMILLLGSVLGVFTILAGCDRVDTTDPNATPKPTATATATATVTTSPTKETINITDDFSKRYSGWPDTPQTKEGDYSRYSTADEVYAMHMGGKTQQPLAAPFSEYVIITQESFIIEVQVIYSATENAPVGGLYFSSTGKDGGIFVIDPKK